MFKIGDKTVTSSATQFWMRPVSFAGLLRITQLAAEHPDGLRANELNVKVERGRVYRTERGAPSATTLYHCRNTLLRLGILQRRYARLFVNRELPQVRVLLQECAPENGLSPAAKDAFGDLVLHNDDCYAGFFGLFTGSRTLGSADFRRNGQSATWKRISDDGYRRVILSGSATEPAVLSSPTEIKSILYGVRYWATKELTLIDEFFRDDRGTVMYPIMHPGEGDVQNTIGEILAQVELTVEWTTLALAELAETCCEKRHRPLETLRMAIRQLVASHPGQVVTVPTSRAFATITAGSRQREELELRVYFRDAQNRYVSHVKIHKSLSGRKQWRAI